MPPEPQAGSSTVPWSGSMHVGNQRDERDGREKLAVVVGLLIGELGKEIFVDAAEDVTVSLLQRGIIEYAEEIAEYVVVELRIFRFWQRAFSEV